MNIKRSKLLYYLPLTLGLGLFIFSGMNAEFCEWYSVTLYPVWVAVVGRICGVLPVSVMELGWYALIAAALFFIPRDLVRLVCYRRRREKRRPDWLRRWLRIGLLVGGLFLLGDQLGGSINYNRRPFSEAEGYTLQRSSEEELVRLCLRMVAGITETAAEVPRDAAGVAQVTEELKTEAMACMQRLGERFESLAGYYPQPKGLLWSQFLSWQGITGIYSNYTAEANYNDDITPYNLPLTVCHELSHLKGYMREDEANFIAFLACLESEEVTFRYSGYMLGYIYASNALYAVDYELWDQVRALVPDAAGVDMTANTEYWDRFETPVLTVAEKANDVHLKAHGQSDGLQSYGRVVDLMLAWSREQETV